ncbi:alpha/beta hydrolase [Leucobacter luti]|uniref:Acetyl esterase/lipase n=1 Tax=Leucobacter luti TaxID=340320 RepID=A0A4R6RY68_9MICO|nr:alpha/beta hydrolase [Leucobacter luti]QYM75769.1 alpha/beta hydrolase [Leucobacter luti]TDP91527.1 acetyl esterase/lipase [Leucobacter luti]
MPTQLPTPPVALGRPALPPSPFDPDVVPALEALAASAQPPLSEDTLALMRSGGPVFPDSDTIARQHALTAEELRIPGPAGAPELELTVFRPAQSSPVALPILVNFHGGGMIVGHRSWEHDRVADLVARHGVIGVNVEYRLAPEDPFPAGVEDNYAATCWVAEHAAEIGGDPTRLVVMGGSAGGGFAAAVSLMARDRGGPTLAGQLLLCPMLDNTNSTVSSLQYDGIGTWQRDANLLAWRCVLGADLAYSEQAPEYAAPSRANDLSGLPPAFIEVGAAEMFRDEDTDYASRIWAAGGQAELHVWAGGCHGFDMYAPTAEITTAALAARDSWLRRIIGGGSHD